MLDQRLLAGVTETRHVVQGAAADALGPLGPLIGDGEAVRLVADALEEIEALAGAGQDHRVVVVGQPDLFEALGEPADGDVVDAQLVQGALGRGDLGLPSVDDDELRRVGEPLGTAVVLPGLVPWFLAGGAGLRGPGHGRGGCGNGAGGGRGVLPLPRPLLLLEVAPETAADDLVHGPDVVLALESLDLEAAVLALAREAVLEDHHRRHHVVTLEVRDVETLDAQRSAAETERLGDLLQGPGARREVGRPLGLVQPQRLLGVALDRDHQVLLVPALRDTQADLGPSAVREPLGHGFGILGQRRDQHLLGDGVARLLAVQLLERVFHQARRVDGLDLVRDPAALAADASAADVEDLDRGFELVLGDGDQVGVRGVGEDDGALLHGAPQRLRVVAQPGRALVLHVLGRLRHVLLEAPDVRPGAARHEVAEVPGEVPVFLGGDTSDAGRGALADVTEEAGAAGPLGVLEDAGGAGAHGEDPEHQVDGLADRPGVAVRAEVAHALLLGAAHDLDARELLVERDREVGIALVVAVLDVEPRVELLDPGVLQLKCLDLGGDDGPFHGRGRGDHRPGARVEAGQVLEVVGQALAQVLGLPDVDHPAVLVAEFVDPRGVGDLSRLGAVAGGVCHVSHPTCGR